MRSINGFAVTTMRAIISLIGESCNDMRQAEHMMDVMPEAVEGKNRIGESDYRERELMDRLLSNSLELVLI
jgi:hypothetical protein